MPRPPNSIDPPSVEEIMEKWEQEEIPFPFLADDGLPHISCKKDDLHALITLTKDSKNYEVSFIIKDGEGFVYISDSYTSEEANSMYLIGGLGAFATFLLPDNSD